LRPSKKVPDSPFTLIVYFEPTPPANLKTTPSVGCLLLLFSRSRLFVVLPTYAKVVSSTSVSRLKLRLLLEDWYSGSQQIVTKPKNIKQTNWATRIYRICIGINNC